MEDLARAWPISTRRQRADDVLGESISENIGIYSVFDGHGGIEAAELAQQALRNSLTMSDEWKRGEVVEAIKRAFEHVDEQVCLARLLGVWLYC
jgi:serine/threonine protein phosphatase PrpC